MNENLIAGYAEYTTADEYTGDTQGDAPGTVGVSIAFSVGVSVGETIKAGC